MKKYFTFFSFILLIYWSQGQVDENNLQELSGNNLQKSTLMNSYNSTAENNIDKGLTSGTFSEKHNISVSYYTGVPLIEIPIYTITQGGISIPIKLQYLNTGVKIDRLASNVGLGWSLSTGGEINRQVYGSIDVDLKPVVSVPFKPSGETKLFKTYDYNSAFRIASRSLGWADSPPVCDTKEVQKMPPVDLQPDIYNYSVISGNGSFIISPDKKALSIPYSNYKIEFQSQSLDVKSIINDSGIKTNFRISQQKIPITEKEDKTKIKAPYKWGIESIIPLIGDTVFYKYNLSSDYTMLSSVDQSKSISKNGNILVFGDINYNYSAEKISENFLTEISFTNGKVIFSYIKREDIPGDYAISEIKVMNTQNEVIRKFVLNYEYFISVSEDMSSYQIPSHIPVVTNKRLKLKWVKEEISGANYTFDYYEDEPLPPRFSANKDHWGLANGANNKIMLPTTTFEKTTAWGANREVNFKYAKLGILKSVIYPTGGRTEFVYELDDYHKKEKKIYTEVTNSVYTAHDLPEASVTLLPSYSNIRLSFNNNHPRPTPAQFGVSYGTLKDGNGKVLLKFYSNYDSEFKYNTNNQTYKIKITKDPDDFNPAYMSIKWEELKATVFPDTNVSLGGLRIKEIKNYDTNNILTLSSQYSYQNPYTKFSSAIRLEEKPEYIKSPGNVSFMLSNSINQLNRENDKPVGYEYVTKTIYSPQASYKTQYKYFIDQNINHPDQKYSPFPIPEDIDNFRRGILLEESQFDSQDRLVYKKEYAYDFNDVFFNKSLANSNNSDIYTGFAIGLGMTSVSESCIGVPNAKYTFEANEYKIKSAWVKLLEEKTSIYYYNNNTIDSLTTRKNYQYSPEHKHIYPVEITQIDKLGDISKIKHQYVADLKESDQVMEYLADINVLSKPIVTSIIKNNQQLSQSKINYSQLTDKSGKKSIHPNAVLLKKGEGTIVESLNRKETFDLYDDKGNLLQYTPENGLAVSLIWGYNRQYPIAKIEGVTYTEVKTYTENLQNLSNTGKEDGLLSAFVTLRNELPQAMITTYTYKPLVGVTSITAPNGLTEYYTYDSAGRLKEIKNQEGQFLKSYEYH